MFSVYLRTFHGHFEPRRAQSLLLQQQHQTQGQQQEKAQDEFSNDVLHVRFCRKNGTSDSGSRRHLGDRLPPVRPCVRKNGRNWNFPSIWNLTCSKRVRFPNFWRWQAAGPRPVGLASAPAITKWSIESATLSLSSSHYVVVLQAWGPMTWLRLLRGLAPVCCFLLHFLAACA